MNSVHEQGPISDSETVLSQKTGSKLSQVHKAPNLAKPAHTGAPRCARVAVSWPQRRRDTGPSRPCRRADPRLCRNACGLVVAECRARQRRIVAWPPGRVATQLPSSCPFGHNTLNCIAIQFLQQPGCSCHDTTYGLAIHFPHQPCSLSHDTKFVS